MKALILSLVIAFSSSFALACQQADATFNKHEGTYTPLDRAEEDQVQTTQVAEVQTGAQTR